MIDINKFNYWLAQGYGILAVAFCLLILFGKIDIHWNDSKSDISNKLADLNISDGNTSNCYNMTVPDTVGCVVEYVKTFYIYNVTDDSINLTFDELKNRGGDCKDWAEFYIKELSKYNITGEPIVFEVNDESAHEYANVHKDDWYCTVDQRHYNCVQLNLKRTDNETNSTQ